ncbi:MAG: hypothetical protein K2X43_24310 [Hyphomonadaceae bacterium]|jgi:hypothetical protein|nr:hypothetical protein [Hyphomonadaceae bacterium]
MLDVEVIDDPAAALIALDPIRSRLLAEPASAAALAGRVGLARQKVNYHPRALEAHNLVRVAEERLWGGLTERRLIAIAATYVVSPAARPDRHRSGPHDRSSLHQLPDRELMLRLDRPAPGVGLIGTYVWDGQVQVAISLYIYGNDADAIVAREDATWQAWIKTRFPRAETSPAG